MRPSYDRLISAIRFPILVWRHLYIESGPRIGVKIWFNKFIFIFLSILIYLLISGILRLWNPSNTWTMKTKILFVSVSIWCFSVILLLTTKFEYSNLYIQTWIKGQYNALRITNSNRTFKTDGFTPVIQSNNTCDLLRIRTVPIQNTIAIGCAFTTRGSLPPRNDTVARLNLFRRKYDMLPFFSIFLPSFCRTISPGFRYKIFVAYDYNDPYLNETLVSDVFKESFKRYTKLNSTKNSTSVELRMVHCNYSGKPAWSQNDALMTAHQENFAYYFMVNDDTEIVLSGWTEALVHALANQKPPNFGLVGPKHRGDHQAILTHNFVHKIHIDIFSFFYPRVFETWYGDEWITRVYSPHFMREVPSALVRHPSRHDGPRYSRHLMPKHQVTAYVDSYKEELRRLLSCLPDFPRRLQRLIKPASTVGHG